MRNISSKIFALLTLVSAVALVTPAQAQVIWAVGKDDGGWPAGNGGGPNTSFVQENGVQNSLPGTPNSPEIDQQADNDYYFAGEYTTVIASITAAYGAYVPVGVVPANEEAAERAFAGGDIDLRYHFNLADTLQPSDLVSVTFEPLNLDDTGGNPHYGVEVYFNGVRVQDQIVVYPNRLNLPITTPQFSLASVNAQMGPGFDNIVSLRAIKYDGEGGGNWMGIDYIQLNSPSPQIPPPVFPWAVGMDDNKHIVGDGGGPNTTFVQENGTINPLPGNPANPEINGQSDNDYYFGGNYTTTIGSVVAAYGAYTPVGLVPANEESAERAFAGADNDLRYHFNLANTMSSTQLVAVRFDALDLDGTAPDPRYGVEVYFNGVKVQTELLIRTPQLGQTITTQPFTLASVNAGIGFGFDNIVSLKGINHSADGGGNWMGIDYIQLNPADPTAVIPPPVLPWSVGMNDDAWPPGDGGGPNATFVVPSGASNPLPGSPIDEEFDGSADDDYYLAGSYTTIIAGNGAYTPVGAVPANEEAASGGFYGSDNDLRYHFNLPANLTPDDVLSVTYDALNLSPAADPRYGVEVYFNNVLVQPEVIITPAQVGVAQRTPRFTLASVNAQVGPGFDNIITLRGINHSDSGGSDSMDLDYVTLTPHARVSFPWAVGRDDDGWPAGNGGGPDTTFVQENGANNPLPGSPVSTEVPHGADNDYYFAGEYTTALPGVISTYGDYTPVGLVLVNEEAAERAFAGGDTDLRYHFNLPSSLLPTDSLAVTFDALNLDDPGPQNTDPRYGVEVYFNGVKVQDEILIRAPQLGVAYTTPAFTLASVDARPGPGFDNIVTLKAIKYTADGGGNWMGIDYVKLNPVYPSPFPWAVGRDDDNWPAGNGGGPDTTFVQENGVLNPLPGKANNLEIDQRADNDYYFSGNYTTTIPGNGTYTPLGLVPVNEEVAERAFCCSASPTADNELRYHFNLPSSLQPSDALAVTFDALNLDNTAPDPRYGVEVYFNGVLVQPQMIIRPPQLGVANTTPAFTLASVNAQVGSGFDNIVTLKGINYGADGGGAWMGIDYIKLNPSVIPLQFLRTVVNNSQVTLSWTGNGALEWAPTVLGPWNPVNPVPSSPYTEAITPGENRFYRLRKL